MIYPSTIVVVGRAKSGKSQVARRALGCGFHVVEFEGRRPGYAELASLQADHRLLLLTQLMNKKHLPEIMGQSDLNSFADTVWEVKRYPRTYEEGGDILKLKCRLSRHTLVPQEDILI